MIEKSYENIMKNKKNIILFSLLFVIILIAGIFIINKLKQGQDQQTAVIEDEYTPEEEISEEQTDSRETVVTVYFPNKESGKIMPEARLADVRDVVNNPYQKLMELLVAGPSDDKLEKVIPDNTIILGSTIKDGCVTLNLSSEILNYNNSSGEVSPSDADNEVSASNKKDILVKCIVNTLTELTEVNKVKIIVEGQESEQFPGEFERFQLST